MAEVKFMYNDEKDRKHLCGMLADKYLGIDAFDAENNELIVYNDYGKLRIVNSMFPGQIKINYVDCRNNFFIYTLNYLTAGYRKKYKDKFVGVYKPFDLLELSEKLITCETKDVSDKSKRNGLNNGPFPSVSLSLNNCNCAHTLHCKHIKHK